MIDAKQLLSDLQAQQKKLESDLREQISNLAPLNQTLETDYKTAREAGRTSETFSVWSEAEITQAAVAWLLACVFLRFCEDNGLIAEPLMAGPGDANRRAKEMAREYFRGHPTDNDRHYLQHAFGLLAQYPAVAALYDSKHNPLFRLPISADAAAALVEFWQQVNPDTGELVRNFTDPELDTRFLGDLYQDLSEAARKRYALLQTPVFVEEFILDRTLDPAIDTFGLENVRMIDPTCGSGHFLLGGFARINALFEQQGIEPRERVKRALAAVHGVDLNPFAVAIARFRLLITALKATAIPTLKEAPGWKFNVTAGDALLHGRRFGELDLGDDDLGDQYEHYFFAEDRGEIERILGQQYHAVVGNPPYIAVKDKALNALYRARYRTCHMKYSLGVPFAERFFQLAVTRGSAGYVGLITTNSFMKREFGKKLIEEFFSQYDLTHVIDTSGAYIPGHGTPTVVMFARSRSGVGDTIRAVLGIRGEPDRPVDAAQGRVWTSIVELLDRADSRGEFVTVSDIQRSILAKHPWSLTGGGAASVMAQLSKPENQLLQAVITDIGFMAITGEDEAFLVPSRLNGSLGCPSRTFVVGDVVRDWSAHPTLCVAFPYSWNGRGFTAAGVLANSRFDMLRWRLRTPLRARSMFGKNIEQHGHRFDQYMQFIHSRAAAHRLIAFAFVATHNHFALDRGGKVFNRTSPVIQLPADEDESAHLALLGLLNSSVACFWMKERFQNRGSTVDGKGARQTTVDFENFYEFTSTGMQKFPIPKSRPLELAKRIDELARARGAVLPAALVTQFPLNRAELLKFQEHAESVRCEMIAIQEEMDWWCYRAYELIEGDFCFDGPLPRIKLGERAFEIVMARKAATGELETTWFERHGSTPTTELPSHWAPDYAELVRRRIALIESHSWIGLAEKPEYKRRWNQPSWGEMERAALQDWLLDRVESAPWWPEPALQTVDSLASRAEQDADFMAIAALYVGQEGFALHPLLVKLLTSESVPALKVLRYAETGLRKHADWERIWGLQRQEDAIDAQVARKMPRQAEESEADWEARVRPELLLRKREQIGDIAIPPKYSAGDFLSATIKRLRGELDVPRERFFTLAKGDSPGELLYGWAGWNHAQRVQAIAGTYTDAESRQGWSVQQLVPLLAAVEEELPWVLQWHNEIDSELGVRLGDYFREWLGTELQKHGLTREDLAQWRPARTLRGRARRSRTSAVNSVDAG